MSFDTPSGWGQTAVFGKASNEIFGGEDVTFNTMEHFASSPGPAARQAPAAMQAPAARQTPAPAANPVTTWSISDSDLKTTSSGLGVFSTIPRGAVYKSLTIPAMTTLVIYDDGGTILTVSNPDPAPLTYTGANLAKVSQEMKFKLTQLSATRPGQGPAWPGPGQGQGGARPGPGQGPAWPGPGQGQGGARPGPGQGPARQ